MNPKVFISHASEDKERFVLNFATRLRVNGVAAWVDQWEMLPGDSLVDKIFEEGLKEAQAVIIVLSNNSIEKPWVKEELNASVVARISKGIKIIPVVLDDCEVPQSLVSILWEPITDLKNYDQNFDRILSSICGTTDKPALGKLPVHMSFDYREISDLSKVDNLVLKESCEYSIKNNETIIEPELLFGDGKKLGLSRAEIKDCIEVLEQNRYLDVSRYLEGGEDNYSCHFKISTYGLENYATSYVPDYLEISEKIVSLIVNEGVNLNISIQEKTDKPIVIINHVLDILESKNHLKLSKGLNGTVKIYNISASLRRTLI